MKRPEEKIILEYASSMFRFDVSSGVKKIKKFLKINNQEQKRGEELEKAILYGWDEIIDSY